jgi:SAM-dependent methyltransferase
VFPFPQINNIRPIWTGHGFQIGDKIVPVLSYGNTQSGWNDTLTQLHEDNAGASHFIDIASRTHALNEMKRWCPPVEKPVIMDIGCSSGFMIREYRDNLSGTIVMGSDVVYNPLKRLATELPEIPLLHFDLVNCPLPNACLNGVSLLNVFEHIEDDWTALKQVLRILKPGGVAVIEVPAGPGLFDSYDRALMHYRRYILGDLMKMASSIGFKIVTHSYLGVFLYPGFWAVKKKNRLLDFLQPKRPVDERNSKDKDVISREIRSTRSNSFFQRLMKLELLLGKNFSYPFGIRCLLTAIK